MEDWQLLQDYAASGSEGAFRTLLTRHIHWVFSSALRQTNDSALAEDVCQAVFALLARKAQSLSRQTVLTGWLFQTTRFVAARALRSEIRRRQREQEAMNMQQLSQPDESWQRIAPLLDEGLAHLGETERNALCLRFFEDKNHREVGTAMGISEEAAKKRVHRGLDKLRAFFVQRGTVLSTATLGSLLTAHGVTTTPSSLVQSVTAAALGGNQSAAATWPALVNETLSAWRWAKIKLAASIAAGSVAALAIIFLNLPEQPPVNPPAAVDPSHVLEAKSPAPPSLAAKTIPPLRPLNPAAFSAESPEKALRFRVVAAGSEEPIAQANLAVNTVASGLWNQRFDLITDHAGWCAVPLPENLSRIDVGLLAPGWGARFASWYIFRDDPLPPEYTLRAERLTNWVGGWLRDPEGGPVAGAQIWLTFGGTGDSSARLPARERVGFVNKAPVAKSDHNGWWSCSVIPPAHFGFSLQATHPEYADSTIASSPKLSAEDPLPNQTLTNLWAGRLITRMQQGETLIGRVLNMQGQPVQGARISRRTQEEFFLTDDNGRFRLPKIRQEKLQITIAAAGYAPERLEFEPNNAQGEMEIRLQPGGLLRIRTLNELGQVEPGVTVGMEEWHGGRHTLDWKAVSDSDGRIEWHSAPDRGMIELYAIKEGFCYTRNVHVQSGSEQHAIAVRRQLLLSGRVVDAVTRQPIKEFQAIPAHGNPLDEHNWERSETRRGQDGLFTLPFTENRLPWTVRVEAGGYQVFVSDPLSPDFFGTLEIALQREENVSGK